MTVEIPKQDTSLRLEICELQTDPILSTNEIDVLFWITLLVEKYPCKLDFALKIVSMFGIIGIYICECTFSNISYGILL